MIFEHETKLNVGDKLYYLYNNTIIETYISGIKATFKRGPHYGKDDNTLELVYTVNNDHHPYVGEEAILRKYFLSKTDILKHIAEQI